MDSSAIVEVYMARPVSLACVSMGKWFCDATGMRNPELERAEGAVAKRMLVALGWVRDDAIINVLKAYNQRSETGY
jgi:hypothetical protein